MIVIVSCVCCFQKGVTFTVSIMTMERESALGPAYGASVTYVHCQNWMHSDRPNGKHEFTINSISPS